MASKKRPIKPPAKVNKGLKPIDEEQKLIKADSFRCSCCGQKYKTQDGNYYRSQSMLYKGNNGYLSICKKCISDLFEMYTNFYDGDTEAAMERLCQMTDMYYNENVYNAAKKIIDSKRKPRLFTGTYVSQLNLAQIESDKTYSDTLIEYWENEEKQFEEETKSAIRLGLYQSEQDDVDVENEKPKPVPDEVVRRFGTGFDIGDYDSLQYEYQNWVDKYGEPIDKRQEELYVSICYIKLNLQKMLQKGDANIGTVANNYRTQIEAATIEIEDRKKKAEASMKLSPVGEMIRDIEEYCPAEYYKDKKRYVDFDNIGKYIERFMARPLRNLLTGSKELDKEFNLSDSEE